MLLEMVIAVGLLVLGMALIGAQISTSMERARRTDELARVVFLAESKIAQLDTGLVIPEEEVEQDFGRLFPQYAWRMRIVPAAESDLNLVSLEILHDASRDIEETFDFEDAEVVETYYTLRATPRPLDLTQDFGLEEAQAEDLNNQLADLTGGAVDVREFSPSVFQNLSMEDMLALMPALMNAFGVDQSAIMQMIPAEVRPQVEELLSQLAESGADTGDTGDTGADQAGDGATGGSGGQANPVGAGTDAPASPPANSDTGPARDNGSGGASGVNDSGQAPRGNRNDRGGGRRGGGRRGGGTRGSGDGRPARSGNRGGGR